MENKAFEDGFSRVQEDMVATCLEYVDKTADKIYIFGFYKKGDGQEVVSSDFFFNINGKLYKKHKINEAGETKYETSVERQQAVLKNLNDGIEKIISICKEHNQPIPVEFRIIYDVKTGKCDANYKYEYTKDPDVGVSEISDEWFSEIESTK